MRRLPIYLSGPMGAGKTTVARAIAAKLGVEAVDLDDRVARAAGVATAGEALTKLGEPKFRELEAIEARRVISERSPVVALGGGTVMNRDVRLRLLKAGALVSLGCGMDELIRRIGKGEGRPLLGADPARELPLIVAQRAEIYDESNAGMSTEGLTPEEVADRLLAGLHPSVLVPLLPPERRYSMSLGPEAWQHEPRSIRAGGWTRVVVVTDSNVQEAWATRLRELDGEGRIDVVLPAGEAHKTLASVERVWDAAIRGGADRRSVVVAIGGGVVGDVAGFAAATLFRGVRVIQVPTTLLAMVDSAIGGKTGIDRQDGKNLIGAVHQPAHVVADTGFLATLPRAERISGLAEVVKAAMIESTDALAALEADADALVAGDPDATEAAIRMAANVKAQIVAQDERDDGMRLLLNLGHTIGHALEARSDYTLRHGEAVSLGLVAALRVASRRWDRVACEAERITALLAKLGLPVDLETRLDDEALGLIGRDKKRVGGKVAFVVPRAPGEVVVDYLGLDELSALVR